MIRTLLAVGFLGLSSAALAADKAPKAAPAAAGEVTLKGTLMCAKCALKESKTCETLLKVGETRYYLENNDVTQAKHGVVCGGTAAATVKGTVKDAAGKKVLTPSDIKVDG